MYLSNKKLGKIVIKIKLVYLGWNLDRFSRSLLEVVKITCFKIKNKKSTLKG
ncbi:hypothetical protein M918_11200 [Clostridium sp. BL8]|nr:hypothetical protein M918_11200 [Clostridium sp. BL8]